MVAGVSRWESEELDHLVKDHDLLAVLVKDSRLFLLKTVHLNICHVFNLLIIF